MNQPGGPRAALLTIVALGLVVAPGAGQQVPDFAFDPPIDVPEFETGQGPVVAIDAAHLNFHTLEGSYQTFGALLRKDGYRVVSNEAPLTEASLAAIDILVIANPLHEQSAERFAPLPNLSAFTEPEIAALDAWVAGGGALLLIADHMPIAGHAEELAAAFGVRFHNGFLFGPEGQGRITFRRSDRSLVPSRGSDGRRRTERVDSVTTFTGQAFRIDPDVDAQRVLVVPEGYTLFLPRVAWQFSDSTPRIQAANLLQGALVRRGGGRIAVFGEAAMFSAQLAGPERVPMGMNHPSAGQNYRFALNVLHWLSEPLH